MLIGQRRVGKSYLLFQAMDSIRERYSDPNIIYVNLELNEFEQLNTSTALYDYVKLKSKKDELNFLMVDEIQVVPEFEKALRSLLAEGGYDIYCTGSNANILSGELGTYLGGRYVEIPVYALNYPEFLAFHKLENSQETLIQYVITSYSIHYTKLYESTRLPITGLSPNSSTAPIRPTDITKGRT